MQNDRLSGMDLMDCCRTAKLDRISKEPHLSRYLLAPSDFPFDTRLDLPERDGCPARACLDDPVLFASSSAELKPRFVTSDVW
jgi:hypothetical protein